MASKEDIKAVKEDVAAWHSEMNQKFEAVESRLGRIESLLMEEQKRKIEHLETRMKKLGRGARPCRNASEARHVW